MIESASNALHVCLAKIDANCREPRRRQVDNATRVYSLFMATATCFNGCMSIISDVAITSQP